jgi:hypothetical protein
MPRAAKALAQKRMAAFVFRGTDEDRRDLPRPIARFLAEIARGRSPPSSPSTAA